MFNGSNEAIATARQGLYKAWIVSVVPQRLPDPVDCFIQTVFEVNKRVARPKLSLKLFACHDLARPLQEDRQHTKGLPIQLDLYPTLSQLAGAQVHVERGEVHGSGSEARGIRGGKFVHGSRTQQVLALQKRGPGDVTTVRLLLSIS